MLARDGEDDSDDEVPLLQEVVVGEQAPAALQIDTCEILTRLEMDRRRKILTRLEMDRRDRLSATAQQIRKVNCREKSKSLLPIGSGVFLMGGLGGFIYFIYWFSKQPTFKEEFERLLSRPDFLLKYLNSNILNTTCGVDFPLKDVCSFLETYTFSNGHYEKIFCAEKAATICEANKTAISYVADLIPGQNVSCGILYPLVSFCDWRNITGAALECFKLARSLWQQSPGECASADLTSYYFNFTPPLSSATCGELLPLASVCDWRSFLQTSAFQCATKAMEVCTYFVGGIIDFNSSKMPGWRDYTCGQKFPDINFCDFRVHPAEALCEDKASDICADQHHWNNEHSYKGLKDDWWSWARFGYLMAGIGGFIFLLTVAIIVMCKGTRWLSQKTLIGELPAEDKAALDVLEADYPGEIRKVGPMDGPITRALDDVDALVATLEEENASLDYMRSMTIWPIDEKITKIKELKKLILFHSCLWRVRPEQHDLQNRREAEEYARLQAVKDYKPS